MGRITIPGQYSGRSYNFNIAGEQPTETELGRIQAILTDREGSYRAEVESRAGGPFDFDDQPGTAIGRGLQRTVPNLQRMLGAAAGAIGMEGVDDYLTSAATERQLEMLREDPRLLEGADFRDVQGVGSALTYAGELLGEQLPIIGGTVAGAGVGALAGAPLVGTALATLGVSGPVLFGGNILRQEEQVAAGELGEVDISDAALAAIGQTALEAASNLLLVGRLARSGAPITRRAIEGILTNAPAEALTEIGQQVLERRQAGLDVDSEEAYQEYLTAGVAGGTLGGLFGAAGSIIPPRSPAERGGEPPPEAETEADVGPELPPGPPIGEMTDEAMAAIGEGPLSVDPSAPITADTLDALGVPRTSPLYQNVAAERLSGAALERALDRYVAAASEIPAQQRVAQNVQRFLEQRGRAIPGQSQLPLTTPQAAGAQPVADGAGPVDGARVPPAAAGGVDVALPGGLAQPSLDLEGAAGTTPTQPTELTPLPPQEPLPQRAARLPLPERFPSDEDAFELADQLARERREAEAAQRAAAEAEAQAAAEAEAAAPPQQELVLEPPAPETSAAQVPPSSAAADAAGDTPPVSPADQVRALRRELRQAEKEAKAVVPSLKRPVSSSLGFKLDPEGVAAQELMARGVTRRAVPGLFAPKAGQGLKDIDNSVAEEYAGLNGLVRVGDDGYFDRNDLLNAIEDEARNTPRLPAVGLRVDQLRAELDQAERIAADAEPAVPLQPDEDPIGPLDGFRKLYGDATSPWNRPLSADVVEALRANNLRGAIELMVTRVKNPIIKTLMRKMLPYLDGVSVYVAPDADVQQLSEVYSDGGPLAGFFVRSFTDAEIDAFVDSGRFPRDAAEALVRLENSIVLSEDIGLTPMVLLHEMVHAVTTKVVQNPNHRLTKFMDQVLAEAKEKLPGRIDELESVSELIAYGMTNPDFMRDLALVPTLEDGQRVSLLDKFKNGIMNFFRRLTGRKPKPIRSIKDDVDYFFETALAPAPVQRGVGEVYSAAYTRDGSAKIMDTMKLNVRIPKKGEVDTQLRRLRDTTTANPRVKGFLLDAAVPLQYIVDYAKRYMPSAPRVNQLINEHAGYKAKLVDTANDTVYAVSKYFSKHGRDVVDKVNDLRYTATVNEVDPFKPAGYYDQFFLTQVDYNPDGTEAKRTERGFQTVQARDAEMRRLNRGAPKDQRRAIKPVDPSPEKTAAHNKVLALRRQLPEGGDATLKRIFGLPEFFRTELASSFRERLAGMLEGQRALQERIYKEVFQKLYADQLINPYQALTREGQYWLSYEGRDVETGTPELYKHSFASIAARNDAIERLQAIQAAEENIPADQRENDIKNINPYENVRDFDLSTMQAPTAVITSLLRQLGDKGSLFNSAIEQDLIRLLFETAPETSFLKSFMKRANTRGFRGDITALDERLTTGDTLDIIRTNAYGLASKAADIRYQARFAQLRNDLDAEYRAYTEGNRVSGMDPVEQARLQADAAMYREKLMQATRAPFQSAARWSQNLTAFGYAMALGGNVSTAALTFFQLPLFIGPILMGKFGGSVATQAIGRATRVLGKLGKETATGRFRDIQRIGPGGQIETVRERVGFYDMSIANGDYDNDPKVAYLRPLFEAASSAGSLLRSLSAEQFDSTTATGMVQKIAAWSGLMQHHAERYVRETTMIADYLGNVYQAIPGMKNQMSFKQFARAVEEGRVQIPRDIAAEAAAEAVRTGEFANGSIYAASAPALSQTNIGRVLYLFKRFPISMMNLLIHTARRTAGTDPEDRRIARLQLAGMGGSMALFAGAAGMPMFHTLAFLYDTMWPKDEDDEDFETLVRTGFLGELGTKGLANYLFGVNLSDRIGLAGVFYRPPLTTQELPWYGHIVEGYGGPIPGMITRGMRTFEFAGQGEYYRALENAMPVAISNALRSVRFAREGAETLRDDDIIANFSPYEIGAQFLGFMPARYEQQLAINRAQQRLGNDVDTAIQQLLRRLYIARRHGDVDTYREVLAEIQEFNSRMPPGARISRDTIRRSLNSHQDRTAEMISGVTLSRRVRPEQLQIASEFDPVSWMDTR